MSHSAHTGIEISLDPVPSWPQPSQRPTYRSSFDHESTWAITCPEIQGDGDDSMQWNQPCKSPRHFIHSKTIDTLAIVTTGFAVSVYGQNWCSRRSQYCMKGRQCFKCRTRKKISQLRNRITYPIKWKHTCHNGTATPNCGERRSGGFSPKVYSTIVTLWFKCSVSGCIYGLFSWPSWNSYWLCLEKTPSKPPSVTVPTSKELRLLTRTLQVTVTTTGLSSTTIAKL